MFSVHCTVARIINDWLAHDKQLVCYTQHAYACKITFKDTKNASCTGRDSIKISHTFLGHATLESQINLTFAHRSLFRPIHCELARSSFKSHQTET